MKRAGHWAALAAAFASCVPALADGVLVLSGGTVLDGYGGPPLQDGVIVIEGERITAVGTLDTVVLPPGAEVVSTEGMTVLPGLWDLQVHVDRLGHGDERRWQETYEPIAPRVAPRSVGPPAGDRLGERSDVCWSDHRRQLQRAPARLRPATADR